MVLRPERAGEGAGLPVAPGWRGATITLPANQLRAPCIVEEDGRTCLLHAVAGGSGIAIAELAATEPAPCRARPLPL